MTDEPRNITIDLLVQMLRQVVEENAARDRAKILSAAWGADTRLEDLGFDSFDFVELVFKLEDHFGIDIDYNANDAINDVETLGELGREIEQLLAIQQNA